MQLHIITSEREMLNTEVDSVILPGSVGQMEILEGHARLASLLTEGTVRYIQNGQPSEFPITGGLVEVASDKICIVAIPARGP